MKIKTMISTEQEAMDAIKELAKKNGMDTSSFIVYMAEQFVAKDTRVILPKKITGKDELAKFLGISPLTKEWALFQDRISDEKVYNPEVIRTSW